MAEHTGKNKAKLTALAQLIRILEAYKGITTVADLVSETGYTKQAIYKAKSELELTSQTELTESQPEWKSQPGLVNQSLQSQPELTPRAYKESPSEINIPNSQLASCAQAREILIWLVEEFGCPEPEASELIADLAGQHGVEKIIQAKTDFIARKASGDLKSAKLKTFCSFVPSARPSAADGPPELTGAQSEYLRIMAEFEAEKNAQQ